MVQLPNVQGSTQHGHQEPQYRTGSRPEEGDMCVATSRDCRHKFIPPLSQERTQLIHHGILGQFATTSH